MTIADVEYLIGQVSIWIVLIPFLLGCFYIFKLSKDSQLIWSITFFASIPQLMRAFIEDSDSLNIAYNLYTPIEFVLLYMLFKAHIYFTINKKVFDVLALTYILISPVLIFFYGFVSRFNNQWVCLNNIVYVTWLMLIIVDQFDAEKSQLNTNFSFFWYFIGILFYAPCTLVVFLLWKYLKNATPGLLLTLRLIHHSFNIAMYCFFAIGIYQNISRNIKENNRLLKSNVRRK
jgi:hypothetical protein